MKRLNSNGFGLIEGLLIFIIIAIIGGLGLYIYRSSSNDDNALGTTTQQATANNAYSYILPSGWSEIECNSADSKAKLASPDSDKATGCDDRTNTVLIYDDTFNDRCLTKAEVEELKKTKPYKSYDCKEMNLNGIEALETEYDSGGGPYTSYSFLGDTKLGITYYPNEQGDKPEISAVEQLIDSVKFQ